MNFLSPSEIKDLCKKYGLSPSKKYGQNYLVNFVPIKKMLEAAEIGENDTIVEIGPGFGVLTFSLLEKAKKVIAFEIEKKIEPYWDEKLRLHNNLEIIWGNAIKEIQNPKLEIENYKVVANLPYQITSHILRVFLEAENKPEKMVVMVQKEVAERICAKPGEMSLLSVSVQYYGEPKVVAKVTRGNFWPSPKVDSAILLIDKIVRPRQLDEDKFFKIVRAGFANKRKQLWRNISVGLGLEGDNIKSLLKSIVGDEKIRAEELSVEQWVKLAESI